MVAYVVFGVLILVLAYFVFIKNSEKESLGSKIEAFRSKSAQRFRDYEQLSAYHRKASVVASYAVIDEHTAWDLSLFSLFGKMDHCFTKIGQQLLFSILHRPVTSPEPLQEQKKLTSLLSLNSELRASAEQLLFKHRRQLGYGFPYLIFSEELECSRWKNLYRVLGVLPLLFLALAFLAEAFFFLVAISFALNLYLHFKNKNRISIYLASFKQVSSLVSLAQELYQLDARFGSEELAESIRKLKKLKTHYIDDSEAKVDNEFAATFHVFKEYLKIAFLAELNVYEKSASSLNKLKEEVHQLYQFCGKLDAVLAIAYFREQHEYTEPVLLPGEETVLKAEGVRHPLIEACVANDYLPRKNATVITGSNMSGKSTFIRSLAINALMAQTINTVLCSSYTASCFYIRSAIEVNDNLFEGKSYYMEELRLMREIVLAAERAQHNLFIIDEIFRGTNTRERVASAKSVLQYINKPHNVVIVSTHDSELAQMLQDSYNQYHLVDSIVNNQMYFDYKLKQGPLKTSNAIKLLEMQGFPESVVYEARQNLLLSDNYKSTIIEAPCQDKETAKDV